MRLEDLGPRICIIGPSNSGKSTLAQALGKKVNASVLHLDQIAHLPHTDWQTRDKTDFAQDHNTFIQQESWVAEGNYSFLMPSRFARATAVIWLDPPLLGFLIRYILRSLKNDPARPGKLEGAQKEFGFGLIKYTFFNYPKNRIKYRQFLQEAPHLKQIKINSMRELNQLYTTLNL